MSGGEWNLIFCLSFEQEDIDDGEVLYISMSFEFLADSGADG